MDLADLTIFRAVATEGGIVKAARRLHRVQSNVTTRVRQLEASLGVALFHRSGGRLHLSSDGERLLVYADRMLRLAEEARQSIGQGPVRGTLRLGALESTTASRLPALLATFHGRHPEIRIELTTGTNDALVRALLERRIDAAFIAEKPNRADVSHLPVFDEQLLVVTGPDHRPVRRPRDVDGDTVIAFPTGCAYRRVLQRWLGDRDLSTDRVIELASYHAIVACVASGTGIALLPASVLETVRCEQVITHPLPKVLASVVTPFVWRTDETSPPVTALATVAREARRRLIAA